jgi:hypothetical protein
MSTCPICIKEIPDGGTVKVTSKGGCSVCGLDLTADARSVEYVQTTEERARLAELQRLHRIAYGPQSQSAKMTKVKGFLALTIIACILVYVYIWDQNKKKSNQANRIEVTYRSFNLLFGPSSDLSDDEKLQEFKHWRMSPVTWKGEITYVNLGQDDDLYVTVRYRSRHPSSDVLIRFEEDWRDRLEALKVGQALRYRGRISEFDRGTSFITLKQGSIVGEPR